ncbi:MAG: hypothetical protein JWM28_3582, partial [Chitinophagaceae bacterium]|nr:hypothetical protein [Chitinophagaceae bacterium]
MKQRPNTLPTTNVVLGYHDILDLDTPADRLELVNHISKDHLIGEIAGLNFRLKGRFSKEVDSSISAQQRELLHFCGKDKRLANKYILLINRLTKGSKTNLFSRQSCMFAIEEILQSNIPVIADYKMTPAVWEPLFQYLLCINEYITQQKKSKEDEPVTFESLNPKLLPLAESILLNDPLFIMQRGLKLMDYLSKDAELKDHLTTYFSTVYAITYERFIFELLQMFFANEHQYKDLNFYYVVPDDHPFRYLFDILSKRFDNEEVIKLLNIRKSPFYHRDKGHYILTDNSILLDKAYQQFINDFWFDYLKGKKKLNGKELKFQDYKSIIGYFFESYVKEILTFAFSVHHSFLVRTFDELKIKSKGIEAGDIYIRNFGKVMLAEAKSTSLYDNEKYGGTVETLYKNDRNQFFDSFGVDQLVENIKNIAVNMKHIDLDFS